MRILVLGGTAWVGRTVAKTARDSGHEVVCLARGSAAFPAGVTVVRGDRTTASGYDQLTGTFDRVIDVARHPGQVRSAVAALAGRAPTYVFVSSGNVYADHSRLGADETTPLLDAFEGDEMPSMELYGEAKVACEAAVVQAFPTGHVLARAGLVGGPGDTSGRTVYWPWRFARNGGAPVLVPDAPEATTQVIDVRDLAGWLLSTDGRGPFDIVGDVVSLGDHLSAARAVGGHVGAVVAASGGWLAERKVARWMGPRSLPLWLDEVGWEGFAARSNARARSAGLTPRPLTETLTDALAWSRTVQMPGGAGLSDEEERELLAALG